MSKASKLITDAILGEETRTIVVGGKPYFVEPPTILKIAKAAKYLDSVEGGTTMEAVLDMMKNLKNACKALSVFIQGDENLEEDLSQGTPAEIVAGLKEVFSLISITDFQELSTIAKSVAKMIAVPRP